MNNQSSVRWPLALLLIRIIPGLVFLSEGIQKFLFRDTLGEGRFAKIGFPHPEFWANFTGCFEIGCGLLLTIGLFSRLAAIPLIIIMVVAFITTKFPEFVLKGLWVMLHDYRTDFAMTGMLIVVLLIGAGNWSLDQFIYKK